MLRTSVCLAVILLLFLKNCASEVQVGQRCNPRNHNDCTNNAYCNSEYGQYSRFGLCKCTSRFGKSKNGDTCEQKPGHGEPCKLNSVFEYEFCDPTLGIECQPSNSTSRKRSAEEDESNGICSCSPNFFLGPMNERCLPTDCTQRLIWSAGTLFPPPNSEISSNQICWVKIGKSINYNFYKRYFLDCPTNSSLQLQPTYDSYSSNDAACICDPGLIPSSDEKICIQQKSYGESCNLEFGDPCSKTELITCSIDTLTCECGPSAMWNIEDSVCYSEQECTRRNRYSFYDPKSGKCFTKIYLPCALGNSSRSSTEHVFPCPNNASCSVDSNVCKCDTGFIENEENCVAVKSMGEDCVAGVSHCDPGQHTSCQNGTCVCADRNIWNESTQDCVALAGGHCNERYGGDKTCTRQASCQIYEYDYDRNICECNPGQKEMEDGTCLSKYMSTCESSAHCVPGTTCIDNFCMCPNPLHSIFDEGESQCFGLDGSTCASNGSVAYLPCISNSECVNDVCNCKMGYSKTFSGTCLLVHGEQCSGEKESCNFNQGLACVNNHCECIDSMLEFVTGAGCVGHEGSPCGMVKPVPDCTPGGIYGDKNSINACDHYFVQCDVNSECKDKGGGIARCENSSTSSDTAPTLST